VAFCPKKVLELDEHEKAKVINPDECRYCGLCELRCPDLAIEIIK
jgi:2-oxoglutarate ferredoxin oxidoreductase subunit delta